MGIITGSEGLLGVITEVTVRILQKPETARALMVGFAEVEAAGECVARDHRRRHHSGRHGNDGQTGDPRRRSLRPCRLSARRRGAADHRTRRSRRRGRRTDQPGRGDRAGLRLDHAARFPPRKPSAICSGPAARRRFRRWGGFRRTISAWTAPSRAARCRKALARIRDLSEKYGLRVANVFHAGDGNLHPLILYDANKPGEMDKAEAFGADILRVCVELGGVLTGEHGVGVEKRDLMPEMFSRDRSQPAAAAEMRVRRAGPAQSRKGVSDPAPLRRTRPRACAWRQAGVSRPSAVLRDELRLFSSRHTPRKAGYPVFRAADV